ncbi:hypothetical protein CP972_32100 [Streptomyces prasinus]|uniref:Uncharacterized protein n=1 Tax=Streptomyces prasinus TaxID=67345 RepID=A0ABX6B6U1_9ACTN|nr:hypothetical protein CP972_32100 [Streptomyces prasinus]
MPRSHHDRRARNHRHGTAAGSTVWTRCGCGSLQVRTVDGRGARVVTRGRPPARACGTRG